MSAALTCMRTGPRLAIGAATPRSCSIFRRSTKGPGAITLGTFEVHAISNDTSSDVASGHSHSELPSDAISKLFRWFFVAAGDGEINK